MKKFKVYASSDIQRVTAAEDVSDIHPALESFVDEAYRRGYDAFVEGDEWEKMVIEIQPRDEDMPKITAWLDCSDLKSKGTIYIEGKIKGEDLSTKDFQFVDDAEYKAKKIAEAAKLLTYMLRNPIVLADWEE